MHAPVLELVAYNMTRNVTTLILNDYTKITDPLKTWHSSNV
jgi:hypothetical protein